MKSFLATAVLAVTLVAGVATSSSAAPVQPIDPITGAFSGSSPSGGVIGSLPSDSLPVFTSDGIDYFGFNIPFLGSYSIAAYVGAVVTDSVNITSFKLYNSTATLQPGAEFDAASYTTYVPGKYITLDPITLAAGEYFLGVGAAGKNGFGTSGYSGVLSVSQVPLPASAPLFGAALLGMGAFGLMRKRRKAAAAAA